MTTSLILNNNTGVALPSTGGGGLTLAGAGVGLGAGGTWVFDIGSVVVPPGFSPWAAPTVAVPTPAEQAAQFQVSYMSAEMERLKALLAEKTEQLEAAMRLPPDLPVNPFVEPPTASVVAVPEKPAIPLRALQRRYQSVGLFTPGQD